MLSWRSAVYALGPLYRSSSTGQRALYVAGTALLASLLLHGLILVLTRAPLNGPVSLRKAMTFAETGWLTCWTVAWSLDQVRGQPVQRRWVVGGTLLFSVVETALMTLQVWRGHPSHYNFSTPLDSALFGLTGVIALVFTGALITLMVIARDPHPDALPAGPLSIQVGAAVMLFGVMVGWLMIANMGGIWQGRPLQVWLSGSFAGRYAGPGPGAIGGNLVLLHALGLHGLQVFTLLAVFVGYSRLSGPAQRRWLRAVTLLGALVLSALTWWVERAGEMRAGPQATVQRALGVRMNALAGCNTAEPKASGGQDEPRAGRRPGHFRSCRRTNRMIGAWVSSAASNTRA